LIIDNGILDDNASDALSRAKSEVSDVAPPGYVYSGRVVIADIDSNRLDVVASEGLCTDVFEDLDADFRWALSEREERGASEFHFDHRISMM